MKKPFFILVFLGVLFLNGQAQQIVRNLGFEQIGPQGQVLCWEAGNTKQQFETRLDTSVFHSGKGSFLVASLPDALPDLGVAGAETIIYSPLFESKKSIKISAFIKTENVRDGVAGIAMRLNGSDIAIAEINSDANSKIGTNDWSLCEIELPLTPEVKSVSFGMQLTGTGKAWFDDFQVLVDDKIIASSSYEDEANLHN